MRQLVYFVVIFTVFFVVGFSFFSVPLMSNDPAPPELGEADVVVDTLYGQVLGFQQFGVRTFLGIPFAAPPVGSLRWRPPRQPAKWAPKIRNATRYQPQCMQTLKIQGDFPKLEESEDCLYLNVFTPERASMLPVMVWIHGGGFVVGNGAFVLLGDVHPSSYASISWNLVVVTIQYRLGPLGFLVQKNLYEEEPTIGNLGLQDQQAALRWVQNNIEFFGGDPSSVTLMGHSAGAGSALLHNVIPSSWSLFTRIIAQSPWLSDVVQFSMSDKFQEGAKFTEALGCDRTLNIPHCLRSAPADLVMSALPAKKEILHGFGVSWGPVIDGIILNENPIQLYAEGKHKNASILIGTNADEATIFVSDMTAHRYRREVEWKWGLRSATSILINYSLFKWHSPKRAFTAALTDYEFHCRVSSIVRSLSSSTNVYWYLFSEHYAVAYEIGATHGQELYFVFGNHLPGVVFTPAQLALSLRMRRHWSNFMKTGNPNGGRVQGWKSVTPSEEHIELFWVSIPRNISDFHDHLAADCPFWENYYYEPDKHFL